MPVQAAEIHLRRELGATRRTTSCWSSGPATATVTTATFAVAGGTYDVVVRTTNDPATATRLTCKAHRDNPVPRARAGQLGPALLTPASTPVPPSQVPVSTASTATGVADHVHHDDLARRVPPLPTT